MTSTIMFIPLKRNYFEAFDLGEKNVEFRPYGARWNERTCFLGRRVTLGYGKKRLQGWVTSFRTDDRPSTIPGWKECYGPAQRLVACIGVTIDRMNDKIQP